MKYLFFVLLLGFTLALQAADDKKPKGTSSRNIDFDGDVVEGLNRQPLDSLNQISEQDNARNKMHLYRKRSSFQEESDQLLKEMAENY